MILLLLKGYIECIVFIVFLHGSENLFTSFNGGSAKTFIENTVMIMIDFCFNSLYLARSTTTKNMYYLWIIIYTDFFTWCSL